MQKSLASPRSTRGEPGFQTTDQRTVQRALVELEAAADGVALDRARAKRWLAPPLAEFTTILLLPTVLQVG